MRLQAGSYFGFILATVTEDLMFRKRRERWEEIERERNNRDQMTKDRLGIDCADFNKRKYRFLHQCMVFIISTLILPSARR